MAIGAEGDGVDRLDVPAQGCQLAARRHVEEGQDRAVAGGGGGQVPPVGAEGEVVAGPGHLPGGVDLMAIPTRAGRGVPRLQGRAVGGGDRRVECGSVEAESQGGHGARGRPWSACGRPPGWRRGSQSRTVPSALDVAMDSPPGEKASAVMVCSCPSNTARSSPLATSQTHAVFSPVMAASSEPSRLKANALRKAPARRQTEGPCARQRDAPRESALGRVPDAQAGPVQLVGEISSRVVQDPAARPGDSRGPAPAAGPRVQRVDRVIAGIGDEEPLAVAPKTEARPAWWRRRPEAASWTRTPSLKQTASQVPSRLIAIDCPGNACSSRPVSAARMETRSDSDRQARRRPSGKNWRRRLRQVGGPAKVATGRPAATSQT